MLLTLGFFFLASIFVVTPGLAQNAEVTEAQLKALSEDDNFLAVLKTVQQIDKHFAQSLVEASQEQLDAWIKASKMVQDETGSLSESEERTLLNDLTGLSDKDAEALVEQVATLKREYPALESLNEDVYQTLSQYFSIDSLEDHFDALTLQDCRNLCFRKTAPQMNEVNALMRALFYTNLGLGMRRLILIGFFDVRVAIMEEWTACMRECLG